MNTEIGVEKLRRRLFIKILRNFNLDIKVSKKSCIF